MAIDEKRRVDSPFVLSSECALSFRACPTLKAVRGYLSHSENRYGQVLSSFTIFTDPLNPSFCPEHADMPESEQEEYFLHRDVIHALVMPIVTLYSRSATLASAALCTSRVEDLEIGYKEDARTAFVLLQCLVQEETAWCYGRGCPACLVSHTLETEATIRLAIAAALMAEHAYGVGKRKETASADLTAFLPAIARAVESDPFWGRDYYATIYSKAISLTSGIQSLIIQAGDLEALVQSPTRSLSPPPRPFNRSPRKRTTLISEFAASKPAIGALATIPGDKQPATKSTATLPRLDPSPLAKQQLRLEQEQREVLSKIAWQVYSAVAIPASKQMKLRQQSRRLDGLEQLLEEGRRGRSLTS